MDLPATETADASQTLNTLYRDHDLSCGWWSDFFLLVWHNETTVAGVEAMSSAFFRFERDRKGSRRDSATGILTVVEARAPLPNNDARHAMAKFLSDRRRKIAASAVVFEGAGFRAAAVRGVVTGLTVIAQQPFPHRVFSVVSEAASWICGAGPAEWRGQAARLDRAIAELRP